MAIFGLWATAEIKPLAKAWTVNWLARISAA
jgi:hypothetical protein